LGVGAPQWYRPNADVIIIVRLGLSWPLLFGPPPVAIPRLHVLGRVLDGSDPEGTVTRKAVNRPANSLKIPGRFDAIVFFFCGGTRRPGKAPLRIVARPSSVPTTLLSGASAFRGGDAGGKKKIHPGRIASQVDAHSSSRHIAWKASHGGVGTMSKGNIDGPQ